MSTVLEGLPKGATVVVIRLRSLGDCVLTTPALYLLKQARPDLRVAVVVEDRFREIYTGNPDVDAIVAPSGKAIRAVGAELCLNLHGGARSSVLTVVSGARWRAGFAHYRYPAMYNVKIPRAQDILRVERTVHTAEHVASAMFYLGVPQQEIPRARLTAPDRPPVEGPYAVVHPFASQADKTWPAARFVAVARRLPAPAVILGGTGDDFAPFAGFRWFAQRPLGEVKSLLAGASLFLGNDSGPAHMAAAFGVPVVVLFGSSSVPVWRPWRTVSEVVTHPDGIGAIPVDDVTAALGRVQVAA
jgi:heptosyltransferase III